jgi:hypothetical protein
LITDVLGIIPEDLTIISPYSIELCRALLGAEDVNKLRYTLCTSKRQMKSLTS